MFKTMIAALAAPALAAPAEAAIRYYSFTATDTSANVITGDVAGTFGFDDAVAPFEVEIGPPDVGDLARYDALTYLRLVGSNFTYEYNGSAGTTFVTVTNNRIDKDAFTIDLNDSAGTLTTATGYRLRDGRLLLLDDTEAANSSLSLTDADPSDPLYLTRQLFLSFERADGGPFQFSYSGNITSLIAAPAPGNSVPEPSSWALMIAGFGLAGGAARQRRRRPMQVA